MLLVAERTRACAGPPVDLDGAVNEWNKQASSLTGYSKEDVWGKHLVDNYISPEYRDAVSLPDCA